MTDRKQSRQVRLGISALFALIVLSWCSFQWTSLLHRIDLPTPTHPWWHQAQNESLINYQGVSTQPRFRYYEWNITRADIAPDGVSRPMILVNGQFPGPPIKANVGDTLVIHVNNQLSANDSSSFAQWDHSARSRFSSKVNEYYPPGTDEKVALHWHGLSMRGSPDQDGAPGFTSCAILPGSSQTYRFELQSEDVGTHWWHSHTGMSRLDGLWGTLTVNDPIDNSEQKLLDSHTSALGIPSLQWDREQVITLGDHYFAPGIEQLSWFISRHSLGFEPTPDNILINGQGRFDCDRLLNPDQYNCTSTLNNYPTTKLEEGKNHRLRLINVGSVGHQTFSIDHHLLTVIEADGNLIIPYTTTRLSIAPGQRYSVIVKADQTSPSNAFWLRTEMDHECFNMPNPNLDHQAKAVVQYILGQPSSAVSKGNYDLELRAKGRERSILPRSSKVVLPQSQPWLRKQSEQPCHDEPAALLRPLRVALPEHEPRGAPPAPKLDLSSGDMRETITVTMPKLDRNGLVPVSFINRTQWTSPSVPLLNSIALSNNSISTLIDPRKQTVLSPPSSSSSSSPVTLELIINNSDEAPHPFHLHGHKFYLMGISESSVGFGQYNPNGENGDAEWFDEESAPLRDTVSVPRRGFAVIRWKLDNPGVWALHCHVLVHMQTGMALAVVDQREKLREMEFVKGLGGGGRCPAKP